MAAGDMIDCFCQKCKGASQPRSTRDGHYAQARRRASNKQYTKIKDLHKAHKILRHPAKHPQKLGSVSLTGAQARSPGASSGEAMDVQSCSRAVSDPEDAEAPTGAAETPRFATAAHALWAFLRRLPAQPLSSHDTQAPPTLFVSPLAAPLAHIDEPDPDNDELDVQLVQSSSYNEPQEIGDNNWEEVDDEDTLNTTPPLPPGAPGSATPIAANDRPNSDAPPSSVPSPSAQGIPLNGDAMAHINDEDPFATSIVFSGTQWSAFGLAHPSVVLAMVLTAWLHLTAHLPYRFCDVVLTVIGYILAEAGQSNLVPQLRSSLHGCLSALRLDPHIHIYPTCPQCLEPHPERTSLHPDARCISCGHALYKMETATGRRGKHGRKGKQRAKAYLSTPAKTITEQLADLLVQPGMEDALSSWRRRSRISGWLCDFFDGNISKALLGPDGRSFFRHELAADPDGEIRIGLALGVDWFSYLRSLISPSYTSCPMSFNIVNLPPFLRYRASNLLLSMIIPGPKETDPDQTQRYLRVLVNELIRLWRDGVVLPTRSDRRGRRVRVILVGVFCDKPAAHKIGGFGSHAHTFFCTRDWITQGLKATAAAFMRGGFAARTDAHHRHLMSEYQACPSKNAQEKYATAYATQWSELARLPYFDMCRMVVVDPMHNLFLGVVKTHFYHIWVQLKIFRKSKEIRQLHEILADLALPSKLGRLPRLVGEPAGGSLTADQWLILATTVAPLALPALWKDVTVPPSTRGDGDRAFLEQRRAEICKTAATRKAQQLKKRRAKPSASSKHKTNLKHGTAASTQPDTAETTRRSTRARRPTEKAKDLVLDEDDAGAIEEDATDEWLDEEDDDSTRASQLHPRDMTNFLKLCAAVKLFLADRISEPQLEIADGLIREYCLELVELYGPEVIRPNHHYATHTADFVRDYGPLREFWTFVFERLNKILKGYRTNNHDGGEIETTFFREFHRAAQLHRTLTEGLQHQAHESFKIASQMMLNATSDNRGTLQQLAEELDDVYMDDNVSLSFSARSATEHLPVDVYFTFLAYMNTRFPLQPYHSDIAIPRDPFSKLLVNMATVFDYVVVGGHRYEAASRASGQVNSLALIRVSAAGATWVGEVQHIVQYADSVAGVREYFAYIQWLRPTAATLTGTPWAAWRDTFCLQAWEADAYVEQPQREPSPSPVVSLADLLCPVARNTVNLAGGKIWITMPLSRAPIVLA